MAPLATSLRQTPPPTTSKPPSSPWPSCPNACGGGRQTLIRTDSGGGTHAFLDWLSRRGRWLSYSVGMTITDAIHQAVLKIPKNAWTPAYDAGGTERPGAWVAEITDMPDLSTWPTGMRLIVRKEHPHPGAQLRFTDLDGNRLTCFATNTKGGQLADLELRHRRRARCEDRIRGARATGLRNLPLHATAQNRIRLEIVSLALDPLAWMPMLALTGDARRWEPKKLRLRLFSAAAQLVNTSRRRWLRLPARWPWTTVIRHAIVRLHSLPNPGCPATSTVPTTRTTTPVKWNPAPNRRESRALALPQPRKDRTTQTQSPRQQTDEDS